MQYADHHRINNPRFTIKSRVGADRLAADLVDSITKGRADRGNVIMILRAEAKRSRDASERWQRVSAPAFQRSSWALLAMEHARYYLIAARAVERIAP